MAWFVIIDNRGNETGRVHSSEVTRTHLPKVLTEPLEKALDRDAPPTLRVVKCSYCDSDQHVRKDCHHLRVYQK